MISRHKPNPSRLYIHTHTHNTHTHTIQTHTHIMCVCVCVCVCMQVAQHAYTTTHTYQRAPNRPNTSESRICRNGSAPNTSSFSFAAFAGFAGPGPSPPSPLHPRLGELGRCLFAVPTTDLCRLCFFICRVSAGRHSFSQVSALKHALYIIKHALYIISALRHFLGRLLYTILWYKATVESTFENFCPLSRKSERRAYY